MKSSLQKIHNIFKIETEHGYDNRAVIGGLDRYADQWEAEARVDQIPEQIIQLVSRRFRDYQRLSTVSRAEVLDSLWKRIQNESGITKALNFPIPKEFPKPEPTVLPQQEKVDNRKKPTDSEPSKRILPEAPIHSAQNSRSPGGPPAVLNAPVTVLEGVGVNYAKALNRLGFHTLRDLLYGFPRQHDDYTLLKPINRLQIGDEVTVIGTLKHVTSRKISENRIIIEALLHDGTGAIKLSWFNQPWIARNLHPGVQYSVAGKVQQYLGRLVMNNPIPEPIDQELLSSNRLVPIYRLTEKITQKWMRSTMKQVITFWAPRVNDFLPKNIKISAELMDLPAALFQSHFPDSEKDLDAAKYRLAFDEIFLLQIGVLQQKRQWQEQEANRFLVTDEWLANQELRLPFKLTGAQRSSIADARLDLASGHPMNRLLQGDVGSGKTAVAALISAVVNINGAQTAIMAPTSILAEQHYTTFRNLLAQPGLATTPIDADETQDYSISPPPLGLDEIQLLIGSTPEGDRRQILEGLETGKIKLIIGTHALIEEPVQFKDLQLVIVDEQHRFGVEQRGRLREKGTNPHLLVMTATPIPRSLALTIYGDLDISVLDEMPPGRQPISTYVIQPRERERAYRLIQHHVELQRQAFIVYPLIGNDESEESIAAISEHARLQNEIFPNLKVSLLHGKMKTDEKEKVMADFKSGETNILVSTTVVEVGVDVPNATVMIIEGANRFGLAQLHQLRGRVGRGASQSYCILIPDEQIQGENERLKVMESTQDGFVLAEQDLQQRGPGDFIGTRQSGFAKLQFMDYLKIPLIEKARHHARLIFDRDPDLNLPEHQELRLELNRFWGGEKGDIS